MSLDLYGPNCGKGARLYGRGEEEWSQTWSACPPALTAASGSVWGRTAGYGRVTAHTAFRILSFSVLTVG